MKQFIALGLALLALSAPLGGLQAQEPGFKVSGTIKVAQPGAIYLGMKSEQEERNHQDPHLGVIIKVGPDEVRQGKVSFGFDNVPAGVYAIQCFEDTNGNGKMDFTMFGIPVEPWGNYRDVRPKFRGPKFSEIAFNVDRDLTEISFAVKK